LAAARQAGEPLPEAMALATVTAAGWPAARMVMLRGLDRGLLFFTDSESDKGAELAARPRAAAVLHWLAPAHRQIRVVGDVTLARVDESDDYWRTRGVEARRIAAASRQSRVIPSRAVLEERIRDSRRHFPDEVSLPRPDRWIGYRILPTTIEFWQEASDGLHERMRYRLAAHSWRSEQLSP
jgi:pyridoxamine 5'-phosphate oxidase